MKTVSITTYKAFLDEVKLEAETKSWTTQRDVTTGGLRELILKSPNDAVIGLKEISDSSTYFNIIINYATSFDATKSFWKQPGSAFNYPDNTTNNSYRAPVLPLHNNSMNLFLFINVNRMVVVVNALSKYVSLYAGRYIRNGTMGQLPNNLFIGASLYKTNPNTPLSTTDIRTFFWKKSMGQGTSVMKDELSENVYLTDSNIINGNCSIHPFNYSNGTYNIKDRAGQMIIYPSLIAANQKNLGELDGIFFISSIAGITPENEITRTVGGVTTTYKIFIDGNIVTPNNAFFAVEI